MSGYALLARAWGAEVAGWDRVETPYLAASRGRRGRDLARAAGAARRAGRSTSRPPSPARSTGSRAAELLAELVSLRRSIVVAGAHGKTTTSAMIAFCLDRLGLDPAFLIGGEIPQLAGNARAGRAGSSSRATSPTARSARCGPRSPFSSTSISTTTREFASRAEVESFLEGWLARRARTSCAPRSSSRWRSSSRVPGEHNRRNAAAALAALELAGVARADAERVIVEFTGAGRRLEQRGEAGGVRVLDSYAHHPAELAADIAAVRDGGRVIALFQPHLYSRTRHLAHGFARRSPAPTPRA